MSNHKIANNFIEKKCFLIFFDSISFVMPTDSYCYSLKKLVWKIVDTEKL